MKSLAFQLILLALIPLVQSAAEAQACPGSLATGVKCVAASATTKVVAHGNCSNVTNNHASGKALMISTATSTEFTSFRSNIPTGVTAPSCNTGALLAWWPYNEASYSGVVGEADDVIGALNGQAVGGATTSATAKFGRALSVSGGGQYIKVPYSTTFNFGTSNFSVGTWVKLPASNTGGVAILGNSNSSTTIAFGFETSSSDNARGRLYINGTNLNVSSTTPLLDDTWHHLMMTVNRTGNALLYVDGVQVGSTVISGQSTQSINNTNDLFLGARANAASPLGMTGLLDDTALWNRVLTPTEVTAIYNSQPH